MRQTILELVMALGFVWIGFSFIMASGCSINEADAYRAITGKPIKVEQPWHFKHVQRGVASEGK